MAYTRVKAFPCTLSLLLINTTLLVCGIVLSRQPLIKVFKPSAGFLGTLRELSG
ncbi:MAG: hypothetical protein ACO2PP_03050 [Thermocrinis sp.]|jgi:hypothetical protein|uniref:hypothetical protein n=1 Tax=Thermocrinis sp. TaxID=2024383 RepID=UPI003C02A010